MKMKKNEIGKRSTKSKKERRTKADMKRNKLLKLFGSICLILVFAAIPLMTACANPAPAQTIAQTTKPATTSAPKTTSKEPVKIGLSASLTGWYASRAVYAVQGIKTATQKINNAGGILGGRPIELVVRDEANSVDGAIAAAEKLITEDKVKAIIGAFNGPSAAATLEVARKYNVPFVEGGGPADWLLPCQPYHAVAVPNHTLVEWLSGGSGIMSKLGLKTIAIMRIQTDPHRQSVEKIEEKMVGTPGFPKILKVVVYPTDLNDLSGPTSEVLAVNPDGIYIIEYREQHQNSIYKFLQAKGYKGTKVVIPASLYPNQLKDIPQAIQGVFCPDMWDPDIDNPDSREFLQLYNKMWGGPPVFQPSQLGYRGMLLMAYSINKAGTDSDAKKIGEAFHVPSVPDFSGGLIQMRARGTAIIKGWIAHKAQGDKIIHVPEYDGQFPAWMFEGK
jgi:branched-chain amino acid transport system substrate-binding protein